MHLNNYSIKLIARFLKSTTICLTLLFIGISFNGEAYTNKKVILLANANSGTDTFGYNFVKDFSGYVYGWLKNEKATLWDSPEKKKQLSFTDLNTIENNSTTLFKEATNIFIYENWSSTAKKYSFSIKGFSFSGINKNGQEVLFGYMEYNKAVKDLQQQSLLHVNANGNYGITLYSVLMNKRYNFSLIYFDNTPLQDYKNSVRIIHNSIGNKKNTNTVILPDAKLIVYGWDSSVLEQNLISDQLTGVLSEFFNSNKQEFLNYGGDKYYSYLKNTDVLISGFRVVQKWTKEKSGTINIKNVSIILYTVGMPMDPIPIEKLDDWKLIYKYKPLSEWLNLRDFPYCIKKINENNIPPQIAENFKKALFAGNWDHILSVYLNGY